MRALRLLLLVVAFCAGLWFVAWWTVPAIAAAYALVWRRRGAALEAMLAALIAALVLLVRQSTMPGFGPLLSTLSEIFPVPGLAVAGITLLLWMILAYMSARTVAGIVGRAPA